MIAVGDAVPNVDVRVMRDGAPAVVPMSELIGEGRAVLFAVPGAFTPGCSKQHLPGFVGRAADISAAGVDTILCLGVNDVFVMDAWGDVQGVGDSIVMVADPDAAFTSAVGMEVDASGFGLGMRSKRYALVAENGIVTAFLPEEDGFSVDASTAQCVIDAL
jgi:glutaredoxin/glutathione-dependent peroxiredoxin